jgi:hypothetical protein
VESVFNCTGDRRQITLRDLQVSPTLGTTPWEHYSGLALQDPGAGYVLRDDFDDLDTQATNGNWLSTKGTGGTLALATQACGVLNVPTAASASDYLVLSTQKPIFKFAAGLPIVFEAYLNLTEAATNAASWFVGLTSVLTSGWITTGGAPPASYSGFMFYKGTGGLLLKAMASNGSTQTAALGSTGTSTLATVVSGQSYILGAMLDPNDGVTGLITFWINTVSGSPLTRTLLYKGSVNLTLASLANMSLTFGVMCGSGGTAETLSIDYIQAYQTRVLF